MDGLPPDWPSGKWPVILADPPWRFLTYSAKGRDRCPDAKHYPTMPFKDILALPVRELAAPDCVLFLWVTDPFLEKGFEILRAWGFKYKTVGFYWTKEKQSGAEHVGNGYWSRGNPEQCWIATIGHPHRQSKAVRKWIHEPAREHSRKPEETYRRVEQLVSGPYLELFSRTTWSDQWTVWGNDTDRFDPKLF